MSVWVVWLCTYIQLTDKFISHITYTLCYRYVKFNIMIQIPIPVRNEFKEKVKNFCSSNNIEWGTVYSECWNEGVSGTPEQKKMVENYVDKLEEERLNYRKNKSFWWRLWN